MRHGSRTVDRRNVGRATARPLKGTGVVAVALVVMMAFAAGCSEADADATESREPIRLLEPTDFSAYVEEHPDVDLINVHVPYQGHLDGTDAFVDFRQILDYDGLPDDLDTPVIVYCRSGNMSAQAAADLADAGYTNVVDLDGGMNAWEASGRELILDEPESS